MKLFGFEISRAKKPGTQLMVVEDIDPRLSTQKNFHKDQFMSKNNLVLITDTPQPDTKALPRVLKGNRPNLQLVVLPQINVDCPFEAASIAKALNDMKYSFQTRGCFNVCPVDALCTELNIPQTSTVRAAREKLDKIHCVPWNQIPVSAVEMIPDLINQILHATNPAEDIMVGKPITWDSF